MGENAKFDENHIVSSLVIDEVTRETIKLRVNSITGELLVHMDITKRVDTGTPKTKKFDDNFRDVAKGYDNVNDEVKPLLVDENSNLLVDAFIIN